MSWQIPSVWLCRWAHTHTHTHTGQVFSDLASKQHPRKQTFFLQGSKRVNYLPLIHVTVYSSWLSIYIYVITIIQSQTKFEGSQKTQLSVSCFSAAVPLKCDRSPKLVRKCSITLNGGYHHCQVWNILLIKIIVSEKKATNSFGQVQKRVSYLTSNTRQGYEKHVRDLVNVCKD